MNIGAIGWWNYDNQGDLAMLSALRQGLAPHHVVPIDTGFPANSDTIHRLNQLDYVLLGGGTLIPSRPAAPFDTFDQWACRLESPLGVVGLGVDPVDERYWPAVEALIDRTQFFHVRDRASRTLLRNHPRVQIAPDLTFAYPLAAAKLRPTKTRTEAVCGVNLRRSGASAFDPEPWLKALQQLPVRLKGIPLSSFDTFDEGTLLRQLEPGGARRFDPALYHEIDLMIGVAFHSVLFAVQAAVPVIAVDYAPKVHHFMVDNGLERYLLRPDEADKLPNLVAEVLASRVTIAEELEAICVRLQSDAQNNMHAIREHVELGGPRGADIKSPVTVVVMSSGNEAKDQRTLTSCATQTHPEVETVFVDAGSMAHANARLQQTLVQSHSEYLTWIDGGDWLAEDALSCLVGRLGANPQCDVVYADYYAMSSTNLPLGLHTAPGSDKLFRRDVIGPCFLMRRSLLARIGWPSSDSPLISYQLWLRAKSSARFAPLHAPLCYSSRPVHSPAFNAREREARRRWRQSQPIWARAAWRIIDSDTGERLIVRPLTRARDLLRERLHGRSR